MLNAKVCGLLGTRNKKVHEFGGRLRVDHCSSLHISSCLRGKNENNRRLAKKNPDWTVGTKAWSGSLFTLKFQIDYGLATQYGKIVDYYRNNKSKSVNITHV